MGVAKTSFDVMMHLGLNGVFVFTGIPAPEGHVTLEGNQLMRNLVLKNQVVLGTVNADGPQDMIVLALTMLGVVMVYSTSAVVADKRLHDSCYYFKRQGGFALAGIALARRSGKWTVGFMAVVLLVLTTPETFDIITSDPIHPFVKGSATLYSKEYFEMVKAHLNPGGVVSAVTGVSWARIFSLARTKCQPVNASCPRYTAGVPVGSPGR